MSKGDLRRQYLSKRLALNNEDLTAFNAAIQRRLFALLQQHDFQCVHIFLPLVAKREVDTWPAIRWLWKNGKTVVVPRLSEDRSEIRTVLLEVSTTLTEGIWGLSEPLHPVQADPNRIDIVVLPLLIFDEKGYRLGYGKGYYDVFIRSIRRPVLKIGLSFFDPVEEIPGRDEWDVPLDMAVTPRALFRF